MKNKDTHHLLLYSCGNMFGEDPAEVTAWLRCGAMQEGRSLGVFHQLPEEKKYMRLGPAFSAPSSRALEAQIKDLKVLGREHSTRELNDVTHAFGAKLVPTSRVLKLKLEVGEGHLLPLGGELLRELRSALGQPKSDAKKIGKRPVITLPQPSAMKVAKSKFPSLQFDYVFEPQFLDLIIEHHENFAIFVKKQHEHWQVQREKSFGRGLPARAQARAA